MDPGFGWLVVFDRAENPSFVVEFELCLSAETDTVARRDDEGRAGMGTFLGPPLGWSTCLTDVALRELLITVALGVSAFEDSVVLVFEAIEETTVTECDVNVVLRVGVTVDDVDVFDEDAEAAAAVLASTCCCCS